MARPWYLRVRRWVIQKKVLQSRPVARWAAQSQSFKTLAPGSKYGMNMGLDGGLLVGLGGTAGGSVEVIIATSTVSSVGCSVAAW
jgi:hypothetical protein